MKVYELYTKVCFVNTTDDSNKKKLEISYIKFNVKNESQYTLESITRL